MKLLTGLIVYSLLSTINAQSKPTLLSIYLSEIASITKNTSLCPSAQTHATTAMRFINKHLDELKSTERQTPLTDELEKIIHSAKDELRECESK